MSDGLRILALNAFHAGSHRAFLDGWIAHSRHTFTTLTLPGRHWKWRMRHAAVTFVEQLAERTDESWDVLFCTDMLSLAEFRGLVPASIARLPTVVYFHENQFTYPVRRTEPRDLHFGLTNVTTALAADDVWFNSAFHRDEFLAEAERAVSRMPDFGFVESIRGLRAKSAVLPPGIDVRSRGDVPVHERSHDVPLRIVWVSRWEHDKDPDTFFAALRILRERGVPFRVNVLGESFSEVPECFASGRRDLADHIEHWGYADRMEYLSVLAASNVVVSTARHEFFGIGVVEAVAAGCRPLVPNALAYPEVLGTDPTWFHDGTVNGVVDKLCKACGSREVDADRKLSRDLRERFGWPTVGNRMDDAIASATRR